MKGLKCTCKNCELNENCHCQAGVINISDSGVCKTKIKKHSSNIDDEYKNLEVADEFDYDSNEDTLIECDVTNCKYNKDHVCNAKLVNIEDCLTRTKCVTKCLK